MGIILLLLVPVFATILLFLFGTKKHFAASIGLGSALLETGIGAYIVGQVVANHTYELVPYFSLNAVNALILMLTILIGLVATCHGIGYFAQEVHKKTINQRKLRESYMLMRIFLLCMYVAIMTANPIIMWIAIEATTLATVFLVNIFNRAIDIEAAWKFLIINSVGLLLGLLGTLLFLTQGAGVGRIFMQWSDLAALTYQMNPEVLKFAFIFVLIGYGTKMGIVPMHTWLPDAHSQAPSPISALFSGALINVAFLGILRFALLTNRVVGASFTQNLFLFFGILSLVVAGSIIFTQKSFKRMLAYSTIEHVGLILLGFGFGGIGIFGAFLHMVYHGLGKALYFLISSNVSSKYGSAFTADVSGMIKLLPVTSVLYLFACFLITGTPPFGMFFSEFYILLGGFAGHAIIASIAMFVLIFVFTGFFKSTMHMVFDKAPEGIRPGEGSPWTFVPVGLLAIGLIVIGVYIPGFVMHLLNDSVRLVMNTQ